MSFKSKVTAAAATLILASGVGAAGALTAGTASAATPSCGASCVNVFPRVYDQGGNVGDPQFVADVFRQGEKAGQPVILFRAANYDPAEDWSAAYSGTVADFYAAGMVSSAVALHYGCVNNAVPVANAEIPCAAGFTNDDAYEIEYAPYGVDSGLCMGVAVTAVPGAGVSLQPCGVSARTVWIEDTVDSPTVPYYAAINGSDTNFSDPFVLTYPSSAYPTNVPRAQVTVANLSKFASGPTDNDNQLWTATVGVLP